MPGTTATQNLTYPTSGDKVRDQGLYIETLAKQVEARLNSHDADLLRSQIPPFALIEAGSNGYLWGNELVFNRVLVDTDGMVDLSKDARRINLTRTGWWNVGVHLQIGASGCNPGFVTVYVDGTDTSGVPIQQDQRENLQAYSAVTSEGDVQANILGCDIFAYVQRSGTNCASSFTLTKARMWAYWVRDL